MATKPKLAAKVKVAQSKGKGLTQSKGGAKFVSKVKLGGGLKQSGVSKRQPAAAAKSAKKVNLKPVSTAVKAPKNLKNNLVLHNSLVKAVGGKFRSFLGAK